MYRETTAISQYCMSETPWRLVYAYMYYRRYFPSVRVSRAGRRMLTRGMTAVDRYECRCSRY